MTTGLYTKDGKLRHPERSVYYDPVFNPFGAPPPGMPYKEKRESSAEGRTSEADAPVQLLRLRKWQHSSLLRWFSTRASKVSFALFPFALVARS